MGLFLASESPRRRQLLAGLINEFEVEAAAVEEAAAFTAIRPGELAAGNARLKAEAVAEKHPDDWVLGADTIVVLENEIFGKPGDLEQARDFLRRLSGRQHEVLTAVMLINKSQQRQYEFVERSQVIFRELSELDIEKYLQLVPVLDKAGAYGIQEHGEILVESINGELENIIGLPVKALQRYLIMAGILPGTAEKGE